MTGIWKKSNTPSGSICSGILAQFETETLAQFSPEYALTRKAKADLKDIARYTQKEWGVKQRDIYLGKIDRVFRSLSEFPEKGRSCDHIRNGYLKYGVGKHVVFYRKISSEDIEIVRILHERMDIEKQFY